MQDKKILKITNVFRLLSDPTRLSILDLLFHYKAGLCVNDIADRVGVSHSAASHQLAKLEDLGIVSCSRMGHTMCYKAEDTSFVREIKKMIRLFN